MEMERKSKLLTLKEVAGELRLKYQTAKKYWPLWQARGIKVYRIGNRILLDQRELGKLIETYRVN